MGRALLKPREDDAVPGRLSDPRRRDFLLVRLSFYVAYPVPLTRGTSISKPLKSNFLHCAPKRLTNVQRIIHFL